MTLAESYIDGNRDAADLLGGDFRSLDSRREKFRLAAGRGGLAAPVRRMLEEQNSRLLHGAKGQALRDKLGRPDLQFVVTGQQTGLFLGPLFTLYKAVGAIKHAAAIEDETGRPTLALFWIQSEDHDFDEIRRSPVLLPDGSIADYELPPSTADARVSVGALALGPEVAEMTAQLEQQFKDFPQAEWFLQKLGAHYRPGSSLSGAFEGLLAECFAEYGLLVFDPRCPGARGAAQQIYLQALDGHAEATALLEQQGAALQRLGFKEQVHVRSSSPLFFFHPHGDGGPRYRLEEDGEKWKLIGSSETLTTTELRKALADHPERFSSSALLRPLVEDFLFPTAAYLGGDAEVNYSAQITPLYKLFEIPKPIIIPRPKFLLVEEKISRLLEKLGLAASDVLQPETDLLAKAASHPDAQFANPQQLFDQARNDLDALGDKLAQALSKADQTLEGSVRKSQQKMLHQLEVLQERYTKAIGSADTLLQERLQRVRAALQPNGEPQERYLSAVYFLCRYGRGFIDQLLEASAPFESALKVIKL